MVDLIFQTLSDTEATACQVPFENIDLHQRIPFPHLYMYIMGYHVSKGSFRRCIKTLQARSLARQSVSFILDTIRRRLARKKNYIQDDNLALFLGPEFKFIKSFYVRRHFDVAMTKRQNTHISETEKVYYVIMTSFFNQNT